MTGKVPDSGNHFEDIVEIMKILRSPDGCPWDMKQTVKSAVRDLLSEADEVREALEKDDMENLREELGDLLWGIIFTANVAREKDLFSIDDILRDTREKIVRRHPHVFGDKPADSPEDAQRLFKEAKESEKNGRIHKG
jgi:uncharacterized protein YabN with tetrapyrrole methylase and pyrophosphatase domain